MIDAVHCLLAGAGLVKLIERAAARMLGGGGGGT